MIRLTSIVGEPFIVNAELIRSIEERPDTYVTLTTGERLIVAEPMEEVMRLAIDYQRAKHLMPSFQGRHSDEATAAPFSDALDARARKLAAQSPKRI